MGNNSVPKFIFRLSRFPVYRGSVLGRFYCSIPFCKVPKFGQYVLLVGERCRWGWDWSVFGKVVTGENRSIRRKTCQFAHHKSHMNWSGLEPGRCGVRAAERHLNHETALNYCMLSRQAMYTRVNKNPSAWNFLSPKPEVTCFTVRVVLLSPYLRIRAVSLSSIHYNQSHRVYINRRRQYICLIWN